MNNEKIGEEAESLKSPDAAQEKEQTPEEVRNEVLRNAETAATDFHEACTEDTVRLQETSARFGVPLDATDVGALESLDTEAEVAHAELITEITEGDGDAEDTEVLGTLHEEVQLEEKSGETVEVVSEGVIETGNEGVALIQSAKEKIHALYAAGKANDPDYQALMALMVKNEAGTSTWKSEEEVNPSEIERVLEKIHTQEVFERGKEILMQMHQEGKGSTIEYRQLHAYLTEENDGQNTWRDLEGVDSKDIEKIIDGLTAVSSQETDTSGEELLQSIPVLDNTLAKMPENMSAFIAEKQNLPPGTLIDMYHGMNGRGGRGLSKALELLNSEDKGVRQFGTVTLALYPVGQFWQPGGVGFHYAIPREKIVFPGETNPDAQFKVQEDGAILLINGLETLPLDVFDGEVVRVEEKEDVVVEKPVDGVWKDVVVGERALTLSQAEKESEIAIREKLRELTKSRNVVA